MNHRNQIKKATLNFIGVFLCVFLSCQTDKHKLPPTKFLTTSDIQLFDKLNPESSGIFFTNELIENERINILNYLYYYNGSGVAIGDINNDGLQDIYFGSTVGKNKLYLNKGDLKFEDISISANVEGDFGITTGVSFVDINNDGYQDLYVCKSGMHTERYRTNHLFINQGDLTFKEQAQSYGLDDHSFSSQAYFFDLDQDEDLDMYLVNHPIDWPNINKIMTGEQILDGFDYQFSDKLFENVDGHFKDITKQANILNRSWGLSAAVGDYNNDQLLDIYVANDFIAPDNLYINQGDGTFKDEALSFFRHISFYSMGSDFADIDNDGNNDLFVADMAMQSHKRSKRNMGSMSTENFNTIVRRGYHYPYSMNTLQYNIGGNTFVEIAQSAGVDKTDWSWAPLLADFDNDGNKDLFISNGIFRDIIDNDFLAKKEAYDEQDTKQYFQDLIPLIPQTKVHNHIFKNLGQYQFKDMSKQWGLDEVSNSNGAAYADLDNDGDLDLVVNNLNEPSTIYKNNSVERNTNNYLKIRLIGPDQNKSAEGTKVEIKCDGKLQRQDKHANRGYLSSIDPILHFGIGTSTHINQINITWPDGKQSLITDQKANQLITIDYNKTESLIQKSKTPNQDLFEDITLRSKIIFKHKEQLYDDFAKELLLPHKLSQSGPFISVADVNNDGMEDFFIGGAAEQPAMLALQQDDGSFKPHSTKTWKQQRKYEDVGSVFFDFDGDGDLDLYVVSGSNETMNWSHYQDRLYENDGSGNFTKTENTLPKITSSGHAVQLIDFDGDGDTDVIRGGRLVPGKYPMSPKSYLLENRNGKFYNVTHVNAPEFEHVGMVTSIAVSDIDNDGDQDFITAGEWMSITVFLNQDGIFEKSENHKTLDDTKGWWYSLTVSDIDQDGDDDIIAGNIGTNNKYQPTTKNPLWVYYSDFDNNGSGDIVLSKEKGNQHLPVRGRECSSQQMPFIQDKFPDYTSYANANMSDIYSNERLTDALKLKATMFESVILINNDKGVFETHPLHPIAQISPINSAVITDINNDNTLDVFCAGNMLSSETETVRYDAGHGTILLGAAEGTFDPVLPSASGFRLNGDIKDLALINLLHGNTGILVARNNEELQLFKLNKNIKNAAL